MATICRNFEDALRLVGQSSREVVASSAPCAGEPGSRRIASAEAAARIQAITQGTVEQADAATDALAQMTLLRETLQSDDRDVANLSAVATSVSDIAEEGLQSMHELVRVNGLVADAGVACKAGMQRSAEVNRQIEQASRQIAWWRTRRI
jgi:methyl-accepting chemotaxis protein